MRIKYKNNNKYLSESITLSQYPLDERYIRNFKMFNLTQNVNIPFTECKIIRLL